MTGGESGEPRDPGLPRWVPRSYDPADPDAAAQQTRRYPQQEHGQQGYWQPAPSLPAHGQPGFNPPGYERQPGEPGGHRARGRRGGGRRAGIIIASAVVAVAVVAAVGFVVLPRLRRGATAGFVPTAGSPGGDARQLAGVFLSAWEKNDLQKAASYTDDPAAAVTELESYRRDLNLRSLTAGVQNAATASAPGVAASAGGEARVADPSASPSGAAASTTLEKVTFQLRAVVAVAPGPAATSGTWTYGSSLVAYQAASSSGWYIEWQPDVVAPNLTAAEHLAAVTAPAVISQVTDNAGTPLSSYGDAGLSYIASLIEQQGTSGSRGKAGLDVQIDTAAGKAVPDSQAVVVAPQDTGSVATTISPQAEAAARAAVSEHPNSSMVVIQPSTGDILAIANNDGFNNFSLTARVAPGSTMKIVTTTALYTLGLATADSPVVCPEAYTVQGVTIHNDDGMSEPASTPLWYDFAVSCNDAFTQWWQKLSAPSGSDSNLLAATAKKYYGLDEQWDIGIAGQSAQYFTALPSASGSELAEEDFGEGELETCPLAMASIAATVESGTFRQPILVPGTRQITATPIPSSVDSQLYTEMRAVVTEGTAAGQGFGSDVYAKTGTADINGQEQPNSWFVAFDPAEGVAVAALDLDAGYGAQNAAPEVHSFLSQYGG